MSKIFLTPHDSEVSKLVKLFTKGVSGKTINQGLLVLQKFPTSFTLHNIIGMAYASISQFGEAEKYYKKSIKLNTKSAETYENYANLLKTIGRIKDAIKYYNKSIKLNPKNYKVLNNLAITLIDEKFLYEAKDILEDAIKIDSKNYLAHLNIGNIYKDLNLNLKAIEHYQLALNDNKNHISLRNNMGLALTRARRYEEALKHYLFILKNDPENIRGLTNISSLYRNLGKLKKSLEYIENAIIFNKEKGLEESLYLNKAAVESELGEFKSSIKTNNNILKLNPYLYDAHDNSCLTMQKIGDFKNLKTSYSFLYKQLKNSEEINSKNALLNKKLNNMTNMVGLIKNSGRTGSIFLHSLLDGHPEITTLPGVYLKGFFHPQVWEKLYIDNKNKNWREVLVKNFFTFYDALFDANSLVDVPGKPMSGLPGPASGLTSLGEDKDTVLKINKKSFSHHMLGYLKDFDYMKRSTFFKLIHLAYDSSIGRNTNPKLIFFHIHNPTFVESAQFIKDFPSARFLQIIRDPIKALESWCKVYNKEGSFEKNNYHITNSSYHTKFAIVLNYFHNPIIECGRETAVIKLEDLKLNSEKTLKELSSWLQINYNKSMEIPNFQGHYYWGISEINPNIKGFSKESINRELGIFFSKKDQDRIKPIFYPYRKNYSYTTDSNEFFLNQLKNAENQINDIFDFEKEILSLSLKGEEKINAQLKGMRILMMNVINNIKNENYFFNFPLNIHNINTK